MNLKPLEHLAIIMDGNGRWASLTRKPRVYGHVKGTKVAKQIITDCSRLGIKHLTLYAFSTENWFRPQAEVSFLMNILRRYLKRETSNLIKENIKFSIIGDMNRLPKDVVETVKESMLATSHCTGLHLVFAISYGSQQEITQAAKNLGKALLDGNLKLDEVTPEVFNRFLSSYPTPAPDLIIRTSGEKRLSNFLLWQAAYSEFYFTDKLWPDFTKDDLMQALDSFSLRKRRFGGVSENSENSLERNSGSNEVATH